MLLVFAVQTLRPEHLTFVAIIAVVCLVIILDVIGATFAHNVLRPPVDILGAQVRWARIRRATVEVARPSKAPTAAPTTTSPG